MPINLSAPTELLAIPGIRLASIAAGIKKNGKQDLTLVDIAEGSHVVAMFTQNRFRAAPVLVSEKNLNTMSPRMLMINAGNANAGTGEKGMQDALMCCRIAADSSGYPAAAILPFSTGVIGEHLPIQKFESGIPLAYDQLSENAWLSAANGIMTTDTVAKGISRTVHIDGQKITVSGIAKGSGMIKPNMATMLSFIATDACITRDALNQCLKTAVDNSFNSITVDGDTSTNDSCVLIATNKAANPVINNGTEAYELFAQTINEVCQFLAQAIIRDAEGVTRFITIKVNGAMSSDDAREVAFTVAHSPLVKTAIFAGDPNWGRILAAIGRANISELDVNKVTIHLDDVCIVENGGRSEHYREELGQRVMENAELTISINLNQGGSSATIWTSDLSYEYVRINAEYRT